MEFSPVLRAHIFLSKQEAQQEPDEKRDENPPLGETGYERVQRPVLQGPGFYMDDKVKGRSALMPSAQQGLTSSFDVEKKRQMDATLDNHKKMMHRNEHFSALSKAILSLQNLMNHYTMYKKALPIGSQTENLTPQLKQDWLAVQELVCHTSCMKT
jgi:hypothetical protein